MYFKLVILSQRLFEFPVPKRPWKLHHRLRLWFWGRRYCRFILRLLFKRFFHIMQLRSSFISQLMQAVSFLNVFLFSQKKRTPRSCLSKLIFHFPSKAISFVTEKKKEAVEELCSHWMFLETGPCGGIRNNYEFSLSSFLI